MRGLVVAHLDSCSQCRREVATLNSALDSISAATVPVEPGPAFVDGVLSLGEQHQLLLRPAPRRAPVPVVIRRRRTLLTLSAVTCLMAILAVGAHSWVLTGLGIFFAVLEVAYLGLVMAVAHTKARDELAPASASS